MLSSILNNYSLALVYICSIGINYIEFIFHHVLFYFVNENEKIKVVLDNFKKMKLHFAIVQDEFGGTEGLVTLEDIIEEIVGEIWDEHDEIINDFEEVDDDIYIVNGSASVEKLFKLLDLDHESNSITVNGWITKEIGRWPSVGDEITLDHVHAQVIEVEGRKVRRIKITAHRKDQEA